ncbi:MAG: LysM peptidoglycan-binding domain-containing protein [Candidatus Paralactobacillus gallistercoris]|uniref:LysM peptidoglycan-binding domain-containing protein n=1 Tax=Candidatus Paralactobacillus gallistercoris TaxID=2838724 RepID=A0A948X0U3_9LACO|nr:LysM peptidoglycan-binding domain-containing protein [Candidatus Paralactobacillus gallistercoris]
MSKNRDLQSRRDNPHLKPWTSHFEDNYDDHGNLSRVASKRQAHGNNFFLIILIIVLLTVIIAPIAFSVYHSKYENRMINTNAGEDVVISNNKTNFVSDNTTKKSSTASRNAVTSISTTKQSSNKAQNGSGYYTVKTGDDLYHIAVNHGLTLNQLLQMNGLSANAHISAGQKLIV